MLYWPTMFLIPEWFVNRRGLAGGIIFAGSGIGGFVFPFIVNGLLDAVGYRWTLRIWAAIMMVIGGVAILGIRRRIPVPKYRPGQQRPRLIPRNMQFFQSPIFWCFSITYLLQAMSYFPVSLYIAAFTATISSPLSATIVLSLFNSSGVIGQIFIGWLSDRMPYPRIMVASAFASSLAAFLLWGFADTLGLVFAFAIVFGSLSGGFSSVAFAASADSAGANPEQASMAMSAFTVVKGLAAVVGPVVSGVLLEAGQTSMFGGKYGKFGFGAVEIFVGSCAAATSITSLAVAATRPKAGLAM
ncbi:major facilitator superfamily domain-containing protein [Cristinia sonorae]|uniref:Major facilitator superfamily domain-containing protein n=1 Tax=Cristinia sonorae TaxID=1940300 RepID=A0A8K0UNZ6_9AGAR|nr:major facilitator superfamily domain-containing protein [Cristinia sonorae]